MREVVWRGEGGREVCMRVLGGRLYVWVHGGQLSPHCPTLGPPSAEGCGLKPCSPRLGRQGEVGGCRVSSYPLPPALEWIPSQFRAMVSTILSCSLTLGQLFLAGLAYAIRDWRQLQLASSTLSPFEPPLTSVLPVPSDRFSNSFSFFHLALDLQRFEGISIFLVQLIFGAVDMPFRMVVAVIANRLGRRLMQAACLVLGGLFILPDAFWVLLPSLPLDMEVLLITLTVLGKGLFSSSASCSYLYTTELYPTVIRQTGMGVTFMMAWLGAVAAPMVEMTQAFVSFLPLLLFGAVPITAGILVNCLPETLGAPLAHTMKQVEHR
uniref:Major facilitator superfamily (MFS) profile domain-containing protein n=1 Tax=Gopherus agassizii TaxID=38772 RepID=A0A452H3C4_9SAUR